MKKVLCRLVLLTALVAASLLTTAVHPVRADTAAEIPPPKQAVYSGVLDTRRSGYTTVCKSQPETTLDLACALDFTLNQDICAVGTGLLNAGIANYSNYDGTLKSWRIVLAGNPNRAGVFTGTAVLTPGYTFVRVTINASHVCDGEGVIRDLGLENRSAVPKGVFSGEATYRAST